MPTDNDQRGNLTSQIDAKVQRAVEGITDEKKKHRAILKALQSCIEVNIPFNVVSEWFERYQQGK